MNINEILGHWYVSIPIIIIFAYIYYKIQQNKKDNDDGEWIEIKR